MNLFVDIISISAVLISFSYLYGRLTRYLHFKSNLTTQLIHGAAFSLISIIGMLIPIEFAQGVIVDGRTVIISLAALFGGPVSSFIAACSTGAYRIYLGGAGLFPGLMSIGLAFVNGLLFRYVFTKKIIPSSLLRFLLLGIGNVLFGTATTFLLPDWEITIKVLERMILPITIFFPSLALFLGSMLNKELENEKIRKALIESEKKYKELINNSPDLHYRMTTDSQLLYVSSSILQYTGYTADEIINRNIKDLLIEYPVDWKRFQKKLNENKKVNNFEILLKGKDNKKWWASVSAHFVMNDDGNPTAIEGSIRDITEKRNIQEMMIQNEKMLSIGGLAAGMAHEINNPMAGMMQSANVIINRLTKPDLKANIDTASELGMDIHQLGKYMEIRGIPRIIKSLQESGRRITAVIDNMLNFARKQENSVSTVDMRELIDKTLMLAEHDFSLKHNYDFKVISIEKNYPDQPAYINCIRESIQQVVLNILKNGFHAMIEKRDSNPEYTPCFIIRISFDSESLSIDIEDNGPGMDETTKERIFDPFYTTKEKGVGTGLGLSVSRFIIREKHQGTLTVDSKLGEWTVFKIVLPLSV